MLQDLLDYIWTLDSHNDLHPAGTLLTLVVSNNKYFQTHHL